MPIYWYEGLRVWCVRRLRISVADWDTSVDRNCKYFMLSTINASFPSYHSCLLTIICNLV